MSKWEQGKRYEFALQWQNVEEEVGDGAPQWRYWRPRQWVSLKERITQCLQGDQWHTFTLEGRIIDGQVYYQSFTIDGETHSLDVTVPPDSAPTEIDRLAIAVQLDGNSKQSPYDVFIDKVCFVRQSVTPTPTPTATFTPTSTPTPTRTPTPSPTTIVDTGCQGHERGAFINGTPVPVSDWQPDCAYCLRIPADTKCLPIPAGTNVWLTTWGMILEYSDSTIVAATIVCPRVTVTVPGNAALFAGYLSQAGADKAYRGRNPTAQTPIPCQ